MTDNTKNNEETKEPTAIDPAKAHPMPNWAGDAEVWAPNTDPDFAKLTEVTGGVNIVDEPGFAVGVMLSERVYIRPRKPAEAYAELHVSADKDSGEVPVGLGYRAAAAFALMTAAFDLNTPEPTGEQLDMLEASIRGQARDILAPREV